MQIACPELYECEKKSNEGKQIGLLYHQVYNLSGSSERYSYKKYTDFVFSNTADKILVYMHYHTYDYSYEEGCTGCCIGPLEYDFYVVERNGSYYIQYFKMEDVYDMACECGTSAIRNVAWCDRDLVGIHTERYQDFIRKECMSKPISVDKAELNNQMDQMANVDFSRTFIECLDYMYRSTSLEMLDFRNGVTFHSDEYVLPKFSACVDFIEFIFAKCEIPFLRKCNLKYINSIAEAQEILVDKTIKQKYHIR